jgi:hypothetical protein
MGSPEVWGFSGVMVGVIWGLSQQGMERLIFEPHGKSLANEKTREEKQKEQRKNAKSRVCVGG